MVLYLLDGFVPCFRHKDEGEEGAERADGPVQPEGAVVPDGEDQVDKGFGHQEPGHKGKANDDRVGDRSHLNKMNVGKNMIDGHDKESFFSNLICLEKGNPNASKILTISPLKAERFCFSYGDLSMFACSSDLLMLRIFKTSRQMCFCSNLVEDLRNCRIIV